MIHGKQGRGEIFHGRDDDAIEDDIADMRILKEEFLRLMEKAASKSTPEAIEDCFVVCEQWFDDLLGPVMDKLSAEYGSEPEYPQSARLQAWNRKSSKKLPTQ